MPNTPSVNERGNPSNLGTLKIGVPEIVDPSDMV